jgi:hypothetical protein
MIQDIWLLPRKELPGKVVVFARVRYLNLCTLIWVRRNHLICAISPLLLDEEEKMYLAMSYITVVVTSARDILLCDEKHYTWQCGKLLHAGAWDIGLDDEGTLFLTN